MIFRVINSKVQGYYFYDNEQKLISLKGEIDNKKLILYEEVENRKTGQFIITEEDNNQINVRWKSANGSKQYSVQIESEYSLDNLFRR